MPRGLTKVIASEPLAPELMGEHWLDDDRAQCWGSTITRTKTLMVGRKSSFHLDTPQARTFPAERRFSKAATMPA
jgi:hypothetical protein